MRRRLLGMLLWLTLLPIVGCGRLLWKAIGALVALRPKTLLTLIGLATALSLPNPVSIQLAEAGVWPPGHEISVRAGLAVAVGALYQGLRSPGLSRLRRRLQRAG